MDSDVWAPVGPKFDPTPRNANVDIRRVWAVQNTPIDCAGFSVTESLQGSATTAVGTS